MPFDFGDVAGASAYHSARGNTSWSAVDDTAKSQALTRGQDHIRAAYVARMSDGTADPDGLIAQASYIAALIELNTPGFFNRTYKPGERKQLTGVGSVKWTPVQEKSGDMMPRSAIIEGLMCDLIGYRTGPGILSV